jgi:hypothetical protein
MQKLWLFKNLTNFTVGTLTFGLAGYYILNVLKERNFENPVINESVLLLSRNR